MVGMDDQNAVFFLFGIDRLPTPHGDGRPHLPGPVTTMLIAY
jgi:hypothetical protein